MKIKSLITSFIFAVLICCAVMFSASAKTITLNASDFESYTVPTKWKGSDGDVQNYTYDKASNLLKYTYYDSMEGFNTAITECSYNSSGRITKKYRYVNTYDYDDGDPTKIISEYSNGDSKIATYAYDTDNNLIEYISEITDKETIEKSIYSKKYEYTFDDKGDLTKCKTSDSDGNTSAVNYTYTYNAKGQLTKKVENDNGRKTTRTYSYDFKGRLTKETVIDYEGDSASETYTYDSNGNMTKKVYKYRDITETWAYTFDSNNNLTKKVHNKDGYTYTTNYKTIDNRLRYSIKLEEEGNYSKYLDISIRNSSPVYDGKAKKPIINIISYIDWINYVEYSEDEYKLKSAPVEEGEYMQGASYSLTYSNNVKPGKAKVKVNFISSDIDDVIINFDIKPAAPKSVKVVSSNKNSAKLSWGKVTGAAKYEVFKYVSSSKKYTKVATVSSTKATIKSLKKNTKYMFCVKAVNNAGKSGYSSKISVWTKN